MKYSMMPSAEMGSTRKSELEECEGKKSNSLVRRTLHHRLKRGNREKCFEGSIRIFGVENNLK